MNRSLGTPQDETYKEVILLSRKQRDLFGKIYKTVIALICYWIRLQFKEYRAQKLCTFVWIGISLVFESVHFRSLPIYESFMMAIMCSLRYS